ncbi:hypothetical protein ALC53_12885 [Atta colombica]|uniref:DNA-directed DNA polymerase n=1 Tax=Atta colombica TaxID=520822 RepID=A0A151HZA5_9HYME|nr:hypothetical protein ALC53_12885 [Atta colombica]
MEACGGCAARGACQPIPNFQGPHAKRSFRKNFLREKKIEIILSGGYRNANRHSTEKIRYVDVCSLYPYVLKTGAFPSRRGRLFAEYINTFLQLKQEVRGWPSKCGDNDFEVIIVAATRRGGRGFPNNECHNRATNTLVRLKLYEYLEKIVVEYLEKADRRVLYYDTDSCIYLSTESYGCGNYIESFVSSGPKFYLEFNDIALQSIFLTITFIRRYINNIQNNVMMLFHDNGHLIVINREMEILLDKLPMTNLHEIEPLDIINELQLLAALLECFNNILKNVPNDQIQRIPLRIAFNRNKFKTISELYNENDKQIYQTVKLKEKLIYPTLHILLVVSGAPLGEAFVRAELEAISRKARHASFISILLASLLLMFGMYIVHRWPLLSPIFRVAYESRVEKTDSQREQRLENTAGEIGLPISTFPSMS